MAQWPRHLRSARTGLVGTALASKANGHGARRHELNSSTFDKVLRRVVAPAVGVAFALWGGAVVLGFSSTGAPVAGIATPAEAEAARPAVKAARILRRDVAAVTPQAAASLTPALAKSARLAALPETGKAGRRWSDLFGAPDASFAADAGRKARFDKAIRHAALSPEKLASAFAVAGLHVAPAKAVAVAHLADPMAKRLRAESGAARPAGPGVMLAYADPSPTAAADALASLSALPPVDDGAPVPGIAPEDGAALEPDFPDTPESTPLPAVRPAIGKRDEPRETERTERQREEKANEKPQETKRAERTRETRLALARPEEPVAKKSEKGAGRGLKHLFGGGTRAGNGVAVYDISAAKVYMPDGSVLEAHSGIGHMADNPKYAHVKMKGPTPPHTYNLKMREKRFHGVEAIRMLPVDGRNKFGRDGFLTHSYLLRGGREESHGCVAFANYDKFLRAFKAGKVRQMVVVPSGGRAAAGRIASADDKVAVTQVAASKSR